MTEVLSTSDILIICMFFIMISLVDYFDGRWY